MLAMIDNFKFEINGTNFEKIKHSIDFKYQTNQRVNNFDSFQSIGRYEEKIDIDGVLIVKSQGQLNDFEIIAKKKKEVTMVFADGTVKTVIILNLEKDRSSFLKSGEFLKQNYKISLQVIGEE